MPYTSDELVPIADLITLAELDVWIPDETLDVNNARAKIVISAASLLVCETAGHPEWTPLTAPGRAILITTQLAKRAYLNPDAERSFSLGPLGGSTVEDYARTLELTPYERGILEGYNPAGTPEEQAAGFIFSLGTYNRRVGIASSVVLNDTSGSGLLYAVEGETSAFGDPV